ncbi:hypothetical protein EL26_08555 [Tumebacillus flagellatus]|uniref:Pre-toxin TG domain-containing protein n=1 Tax=Tumebacillus flagellatus TaxID=1157490 RepID=A0A074LRI0_9BACL|nr:hypothetical protein EL26_08555 [Tumebacillus flagellatus]
MLNSLATHMDHILELRRQAQQYEMASWEYSGDSQDDLHHRQNLARQAAHLRQQADWEANQADSVAKGQLGQIMSMLPNVINNGSHGTGSSVELDDLPEPMRSYYLRHPELREADSVSEVVGKSSWASVKKVDETSIQQDKELRSRLLALLKQLTKKERMGWWDESTDQIVFQKDYGDMPTEELKAQIFARLYKMQGETNSTEDEIQAFYESVSMGADFIPVVGNLKSLVEASTGRDYITGDDLTWVERGFSLAGVVGGGFIKLGGKSIKTDKGLKYIYEIARGLHASVEVGREVTLPRVETYEQARNLALELVGDLGPDAKSVIGTLDKSQGYGKVIGRRSEDGKVLWRLDYDPIKGMHINIEDYREGKGEKAIKLCIPFDGNEDTFISLLKHLN